MKKQKIKAIIFDMDGVLIDAAPWHYEAFNQAINLFGFSLSEQEHDFFYNGLPTKVKLDRLNEEKDFPLDLQDLVSELKQIYTMEIIYSRCKPKFHTSYALARLKEEGFHLCVASNSIRQTIEMMMEKSALAQYLDFILSNQDVKKSKPDPEIYLKAFEKLKLDPKECVIVEDSENGFQAAMKSGGNVFRVKNVSEVNYNNIVSYISNL